MEFYEELITIRINTQIRELLNKIKKEYPNDYKTDADVLRGGVFTLAKWKYKYSTDIDIIAIDTQENEQETN